LHYVFNINHIPATGTVSRAFAAGDCFSFAAKIVGHGGDSAVLLQPESDYTVAVTVVEPRDPSPRRTAVLTARFGQLGEWCVLQTLELEEPSLWFWERCCVLLYRRVR
jgi:hypothetical protein